MNTLPSLCSSSQRRPDAWALRRRFLLQHLKTVLDRSFGISPDIAALMEFSLQLVLFPGEPLFCSHCGREVHRSWRKTAQDILDLDLRTLSRTRVEDLAAGMVQEILGWDLNTFPPAFREHLAALLVDRTRRPLLGRRPA